MIVYRINAKDKIIYKVHALFINKKINLLKLFFKKHILP